MKKTLSLCVLVLTTVFTAAAGPVVQDSSFENVSPGSYPFYEFFGGFSSPSWTFGGGSGVDPSSGTWFVPAPPDGTNAAFLQNISSFSQTISGFTIGNLYTVSYYAAQRPGYAANSIDVSLGGVDLGAYLPSSTAFVQVTTSSMTATSDTMALTFQGTFNGGDFDSAVDVVTISDPSPAPEPSTLVLGGLSLIGLGILRRKRTV